MFRAYCLISACSAAALAAPSDGGDFFEKTIRPILVQNCGDCHGSWIQKAGLSMATAAEFDKGSARGKIVDRAHPGQSRILEVIGYEGQVKMPPTGKLKPDQIEAIANWVKNGA